MTPDRRILALTRAAFEQKRRAADEERLRVRAQAYAAAPELEEMDEALRALGVEIARSVFHTDGPARIARIKERAATLRQSRAKVLARHELRDAEEMSCPHCGDTGVMSDGRLCDCFREEYARRTLTYLDGKLPAATGDFSCFDERLFSSAEDASYGISPRDAARANARVCVEFAEGFDKTAENLYMTGPASCGKTCLAAAIARRAAKRGFSVEYETAFSLCAAMEAQRFGRADENTDAAVRAAFENDLLIVDDLGCEMSSAFSGPAIYNLINTRLAERRSTVILSELTAGELSQRYLPQTAGRIANDYTNLIFLAAARRGL